MGLSLWALQQEQAREAAAQAPRQARQPVPQLSLQVRQCRRPVRPR
jgi:hypothetical protein